MMEDDWMDLQLATIPETLVPAQFFEQNATSPEKFLMTTLIQSAYDDFHGQSKYLKDEARRWLESPNDSWIFSFLNICNTLNLNPTHIRHLIYSTPKISYHIRCRQGNGKMKIQDANYQKEWEARNPRPRRRRRR